jgi:thiol-disulfide isomerase/thioredoxin
MISPFRRTGLAAAALCLTALLALAPTAARADSPQLTQADLQRIATEVGDSAKAVGAAEELRAYLAGSPDSAFVPFCRVIMVQALVTSHAPVDQLLKSVDEAEKVLPDNAALKVQFYVSLSRVLVDRNIALDRAQHYAVTAIDVCPKEEEAKPMLAAARSALGDALLAQNKAAEAIRQLDMALPDTRDSAIVLRQLGRAYEMSGKNDQAINCYIRSVAVFGAADSTALEPLRALWKKKNGSLTGLDARISTAHRASLKRIALDAHAVGTPRPAPGWRLPDLDEKVHDLQAYKGKVVVMDFWGSWCGPCKMELPFFEAMYRKYKDKPNVAFVSINWEKTNDALQHRTTAREFIQRNNYTFPVMYDHEQVAVKAYQIEGFPTVFTIDKTGVVRYVNIGFDPQVDKILEAQIQSLLN